MFPSIKEANGDGRERFPTLKSKLNNSTQFVGLDYNENEITLSSKFAVTLFTKVSILYGCLC